MFEIKYTRGAHGWSLRGINVNDSMCIVYVHLQDAKDVNSSKLSWRRLNPMSSSSSSTLGGGGGGSSPNKKAAYTFAAAAAAAAAAASAHASNSNIATNGVFESGIMEKVRLHFTTYYNFKV